MPAYDISEDTKEVFLKGKIKWANSLFVPDTMYEPKWQAKLYPDEDSVDIIRELQSLGLMNKIAKDDDGWYTSVSRPTQKMFKGVLKPLTPPVIEDNEGNPITSNIIGNGSDVICKMEVYKYKAQGGNRWKVAYRLASVRVVNLIKFERDNDFSDSQKRQSDGITEQEMTF